MNDATRLANALEERYRIERQLGAGGMATVYLATDLKHDREVALKVLRPELGAVLGAERFLAEIKITARLDHPHILTLIDSGEAGGFLFYVLPLVRGESLRDKLKREQQLGLEEALAITKQVASALDYAHRPGVVHRDIKPENILLFEGEAMLADFGIALAVKEAGGNRLTETGLSLGTPQYMSPEQATGDRLLDARSDVYSLAAVLYEMLAGEPPVTGPNAQAMIAKLMTERPVHLRVVRGSVPDNIDAAVAKALDKTPADRFGSAGDFARALELKPITGTVPIASSSVSAGKSKRGLWIGLAAVALVAAVAGAFAMKGKPAGTSARRVLRPSRPHPAHDLGQRLRLRHQCRRQAARLHHPQLRRERLLLRGRHPGRRRHHDAPHPRQHQRGVRARVESRPPQPDFYRHLEWSLRHLSPLGARRDTSLPQFRRRHVLRRWRLAARGSFRPQRGLIVPGQGHVHRRHRARQHPRRRPGAWPRRAQRVTRRQVDRGTGGPGGTGLLAGLRPQRQGGGSRP